MGGQLGGTQIRESVRYVEQTCRSGARYSAEMLLPVGPENVFCARLHQVDLHLLVVSCLSLSVTHTVQPVVSLQVLDFSRSVHEDLSNFDLNGAWVWLLDDFVEYMKKARQTRCGWVWGWCGRGEGRAGMCEKERGKLWQVWEERCGRDVEFEVALQVLCKQALGTGLVAWRRVCKGRAGRF